MFLTEFIKFLKKVIKKLEKQYKTTIYFTTINTIMRIEFEKYVMYCEFCNSNISYEDVTNAISHYQKCFSEITSKTTRYCIFSRSSLIDGEIETYAKNNNIGVEYVFSTPIQMMNSIEIYFQKFLR